MKRELSRRNLLKAGTSMSAVVPWPGHKPRWRAAKAEGKKGSKLRLGRQAQMAAKRQPANKPAETAGQIDIAVSKSAKPADRISSAEDGTLIERQSS